MGSNPFHFPHNRARIVTLASFHAIEKAVERDYFMIAEEALAFGLIDRVLEKRAVPAAEQK